MHNARGEMGRYVFADLFKSTTIVWPAQHKKI